MQTSKKIENAFTFQYRCAKISLQTVEITAFFPALAGVTPRAENLAGISMFPCTDRGCPYTLHMHLYK